MAVHVEDHPIEYFDFEGVDPSEQYGAGDVIVWDWGTWEPEAPILDPRPRHRGRGVEVHPARREGQRPVHDRPDQRAPPEGRRPGGAGIRGRRGPAVAPYQEARRGVRGRLGRRRPPAKRQDRPDQRRRQGRSRRAVERRGARGRGRDRPDRGRRGQDAPLHRTDAGHARLEGCSATRTGCTRSSGTGFACRP